MKLSIASLLLVALVTVSSIVIVRAQSNSGYVSIDSVDCQSAALPKQRVVITVHVSYMLSQKAEIGISVASGSDLLARSRGGSVNPSSGSAAGARLYYVAIIMPTVEGPLQLTAHAFHSYGSGWIGDASKDFTINVSGTSGFSLPSNEFTGGIEYPAGSNPSTSEVTGSLAVSQSGNSISFRLTTAMTSSDAVAKGIVYLIGIDTTDTGESVQNPHADYEIRINPATPNATLESKDGKTMGSLGLIIQTNSYDINGVPLQISGNSFDVHVLGYQHVVTPTTSSCSSGFVGGGNVATIDGFYQYFGGGGGYSGPPVVGPSCYTEPGNSYDIPVLETPAGAWAPVALPYQLTISTPVAIQLDGTTEGPVNNIISISAPAGLHSISVPRMVQSSVGTRLMFDHWSDGSSDPACSEDLNADTNLAAIFRTQYELVLNSQVNATGEGWYDSGSTVTFSVPPTYLMTGILGLLGGKWSFNGWYEEANLISSSASDTLTMNASHILTADWTADYTQPSIILGVTLAVVIIGLFLYLKRGRAQQTGVSKSITERLAFFHSFNVHRKPQQAKLSRFIPTKPLCVKCGAMLPPASEFCNKCGTKQS